MEIKYNGLRNEKGKKGWCGVLSEGAGYSQSELIKDRQRGKEGPLFPLEQRTYEKM